MALQYIPYNQKRSLILAHANRIGTMKQVVLITGGTMGIGLGLAQAFLARGDEVAVCGRSAEALESFTRAHPQALAIRADLSP
jgi:short-subunit dehydrogenase involved in D-alanine esterification of teichoic acids